MADELPLEVVLVIVAPALLLFAALASFFVVRRRIFRPYADRSTGEQRRALWPLEKDWPASCPYDPPDEDVVLTRDLFELRDGSKIFSVVITPRKRKASKVLILLHGYGTNGNQMRMPAKTLALEHDFVVICPDLPGHGRSDGLFASVPDWFGLVDKLWEYLDFNLPALVGPIAGAWPAEAFERLPLFILGESMGGGLAATLAMQRPQAFDGVILIAPMLYVSDSIKPPWIVQLLGRYLATPLFPHWPVTPAKSFSAVNYRDTHVAEQMASNNAFAFTCKCRLATAIELAFRFPEWLSANTHLFTAPFLILHGESDLLTDPAMSKRFYEDAPAADKMLKLIHDAYHLELFHPGVKAPYAHDIFVRVISDIGEWTAHRSERHPHAFCTVGQGVAIEACKVDDGHSSVVPGDVQVPKACEACHPYLANLPGEVMH